MPTDHAIEAVHLTRVFSTRWTRRQGKAVNDISFSVPRINSHLLAEVEQFCSEVAILRKGQVALAGNVKDLTIGRGYRLTTCLMPEQLRLELERDCLAVTVRDGTTEFQYPRREAANRAIDALRAQRVEIESLVPTTSTLEDVFLRTIETGPAQ